MPSSANFLIYFLLMSFALEPCVGAGSSASFQGILQQVTAEKLEELRIQKDLMQRHFHPALKRANVSSNTPKETLDILYTAVKTSPVKDVIDSNLITDLKNILKNSETDPSLTPQFLSAWNQNVQTKIEQALRRGLYSYYFGSLLGEWLESEERRIQPTKSNSDESSLKVAEEEAVKKFSKKMFKTPSSGHFSSKTFRKYLNKEIFDAGESKDIESLVKQIRKEASEFLGVEDHVVLSTDVKSCITGLLSEDLLPEDKKSALRELSENTDTLTEVAALLTNRLKNIDRWDWPNSTILEPVDVRRGLGGEYKIFLNEDLITSLFLQFVGVKWAAFFKQRFLRIYNSKMWTRPPFDYNSIEGERDRFHRNTFLSTLPDSLQSQENKHKEEYVKIESMPFQGSMAFMTSGVSRDDGEDDFPRPLPPPKPEIDIKQEFLHVLATEIRLNQVIFPDKPLVVVQSYFDTLTLTMNHDAILIAMEKFGVSKQWLDFFIKFLQPHIKFKSDAEPRRVLRGLPESHALSKLFGETILFMLESIVNRKCNGMKIYRIADEVWFWNKEKTDVVNGWTAMKDFADMVGLKVNEKLSGSAKILGEASSPESIPGPKPLPERNIHWGYLELTSNGAFNIDQKSITKFLDEMKALLKKTESALEWIQIFNKYMGFFCQNFEKGSNVLGKQHLDKITKSFREIHMEVFGSLEKSPVHALRGRFSKLAKEEFLDAWIYWPLEMGGLGLLDPFIDIMALGMAYEEMNDEDLFRKLPLQDKIEWEELSGNYNRTYGMPGELEGGIGQSKRVSWYKPEAPEYVTWEKYIAGRETKLGYWRARYESLQDRPEPISPEMPSKFHRLGSIIPTDPSAEIYFKWLYNYFEPQLELYFGTSTFISSGLLPKSMIDHIQKAKLNY